MTIGSVSSTSSFYPQQDTTRATARNFVNAIQSGDLKTAQQDYTTLTQSSTAVSSTSPLAQDFSVIGQALNSGDISGAQNALATLQTDAQKAGKGHHHHHHHAQAGSPYAQSAAGTADASNSSSSSGAATSTFSVSA